MRKMGKRVMAYFLMTVCMIMQVAAVMPHHHHNHLLCIHDDLEGCPDCCHPDECGCGSTHEQDGGHHECDACCVTHFLFDQTDAEDDETTPQYTFSFDIHTLYNTMPCVCHDASGTDDDAAGFTELLHDTSAVGSKGLRSPPPSV